MLASRRWGRMQDPSIRVAPLRSFKCGMVMVLVGIIWRPMVGVVAGTRTPIIPGNGEGIGLAHIGHPTIFMAFWVHRRHGASRTLDGVSPTFPTVATVTGARYGIPTQNGEVHTEAGVIPSRPV
jgi:hypothetical protein